MGGQRFKGFGDKAMPFFKALEFHMSRDWFNDNKALFESTLKTPIGDLIEDLSDRFQAAGLGLRGDRKHSLFRIYRDVRFAKDKRPYNLHVSGILSPDGTRSTNGVVYIHVGLSGCFAGVAWYSPEPPLLEAFRQAIVTRPSDYRAMVAALKKKGLALSGEDRLKRPPRGYSDIADADLAEAVRNRHFYVNLTIDPSRIASPALVDDIVAFTLAARPLLDWGRRIDGSHQPG